MIPSPIANGGKTVMDTNGRDVFPLHSQPPLSVFHNSHARHPSNYRLFSPLT